MTIYTDRTRFTRGFECRWKRLLGFHAFGTGITANRVAVPLALGRHVHTVQEEVTKILIPTPKWSDTVQLTVRKVIQDTCDKLTKEFEEELATQPTPRSDEDRRQMDLLPALTHGYARAVLPWVLENYEIVASELEISYPVPNTDVIWMARPDLVLRTRVEPGSTDESEQPLTIVDYKTASYWNAETGPSQWASSIQMMANAYVTGWTLQRKVDTYYMHMLVKGNKRYPNHLTHAYFRAASPPLFEDKWTTARTAKMSKVRVADYRTIQDWIWNGLKSEEVGEKFPVVGPFTVHQYTVEAFFRGVEQEEMYWHNNLKDLDWTQWHQLSFQNELDRRFPRTFACHDFTGSRCQFYDLCHKQPEWGNPMQSERYKIREPHHPQEENEDA